jgi:orotate phosphoribosyltransferase
MVDRGGFPAKLFADRNVPFVALVTYRDLGIEPVKAV